MTVCGMQAVELVVRGVAVNGATGVETRETVDNAVRREGGV